MPGELLALESVQSKLRQSLSGNSPGYSKITESSKALLLLPQWKFTGGALKLMIRLTVRAHAYAFNLICSCCRNQDEILTESMETFSLAQDSLSANSFLSW